MCTCSTSLWLCLRQQKFISAHDTQLDCWPHRPYILVYCLAMFSVQLVYYRHTNNGKVNLVCSAFIGHLVRHHLHSLLARHDDLQINNSPLQQSARSNTFKFIFKYTKHFYVQKHAACMKKEENRQWKMTSKNSYFHFSEPLCDAPGLPKVNLGNCWSSFFVWPDQLREQNIPVNNAKDFK